MGKFARLANDVLQSINLETLELGSSTHYVARRSFIGECETVQVAAAVISQCTHLANRLSSITTATTGQTAIGSGTQSDLLMVGIKMPETC